MLLTLVEKITTLLVNRGYFYTPLFLYPQEQSVVTSNLIKGSWWNFSSYLEIWPGRGRNLKSDVVFTIWPWNSKSREKKHFLRGATIFPAVFVLVEESRCLFPHYRGRGSQRWYSKYWNNIIDLQIQGHELVCVTFHISCCTRAIGEISVSISTLSRSRITMII